jgi:hypothetical protein
MHHGDDGLADAKDGMKLCGHGAAPHPLCFLGLV